MKILLTGANGQLGRCFQDAVAVSDTMKAITLQVCTSIDLDITNESAVAVLVNDFKPDFIVNAAAYTAVDKAEQELDQADKVNHLGPKYLAQAAQKCGAWLLHVSTDYVFDGKSVEPYKPDSITNPQNVYGKTKLMGEQAVLTYCSKAMVFRTAWVFSEYGNNFVKTMVRLAKERDEISVVSDQYGCPTYAGDIAKALLSVCMLNSISEKDVGIYHISGDQSTSWHGFARAIFALSFKQGIISKLPILHAIPSSAYPVPAQRPEYSVLDTSKSPYGMSLSSNWLSSLKCVLDKLAKD